MNWFEFGVFALFAIVAVSGGLVMVAARNPVYSAMGLLAAMFSVAVFYVLNLAHFVAAVQVIIYAGAVMTLFLFVIMLIGVDRSEDATEKLPLQRPLAMALGAALLLLVGIGAGFDGWITGGSGPAPDGSVESVADELFGTWLLPFEATILLLTIAAVGTIALAQFRTGASVTVPPGSGPAGTGPAGTGPAGSGPAGTGPAHGAPFDETGEPS